MYYLLFGLGMALVGSSVVIGKELTTQLPVFFTVEIRLLISLIIFYVILKIRKETFPVLERKDYGVLFLQSSTGILLYNVLLFYGLRYTSGVEAGIILSLSPIFAAISAFFLLKERVSYLRWLGIILAVGGVALINLHSFGNSMTEQSHGLKLLGTMMILCVAASEGLFSVASKYNRAKLSAYQICFIIAGIAFVLFLPLSVYQAFQVNYAQISSTLIFQLLYFTIFVGVIPYILTFTAVKYIAASTAGVLTVIIPISSIVLSVVFLGEAIQRNFLIGSIIALVGIFIVTKFE